MSQDQYLAEIGKASGKDISAYQRALCDSTILPERWDMFREYEFNRLYTIENLQWLEEATAYALAAQGEGYMVNPFLQRAQMPADDIYQAMPVQNEMLPIIQNEIARLVAGKTDFVINPTQRSTSIERAARLAVRVLKADNIKRNWRGMETNLARDMAVFGTGLMRTAQEMDFINTMAKALEVSACKSCQWMAVKDSLELVKGMPVIGGKQAQSLVTQFGGRPYNFRMEQFGDETAEPMLQLNPETLEPEPKAFLTACPECGDSLIDRDADVNTEKTDFADNPVIERVPTSDAGLQVISPYDFFPSANGRLDPDGKIRCWTIERLVSADWVAAHYRDGHKVEPCGADDDMSMIAPWHPIGGEDGSFAALKSTNGRRLDGLVVWRETVRLPYWEKLKAEDEEKTQFPNGRWLVTAGDTTLIDEELMIEDERSGEKVARSMVHWCQWEERKGCVWGKALATFLRSQQDALNTVLAQSMEMRHLHGNPKVLLGPTSSFDYAGQGFGGWQNSQWRWQGEKPEWVQGMALNESWKFEVQNYTEGLQRTASARAVESGQAPGAGVTAFSAIQLLNDNAAITRQPRIDGKRVAIAAQHRHRLQLMGVLYEDERQFRAGDRGDYQSFKAFRGADLCGQYDVELLSTPFAETPLLRREAAMEGFLKGTLILRTAADRQRFNEIIGVPADIAPGDGIQIERAKREWLTLVQMIDTPEGTASTYNLSKAAVVKWFDDDLIHIDQHLEDESSWEGEEMREHEDQFEILLAGWRDEYKMLDDAEMELKLDPPGEMPKASMLRPGPTGEIAAESAMMAGELWIQKKKLAETLAGLPKTPELRVLHMWSKKLEEQGYRPAKGDQAPDWEAKALSMADLAFLRHRAHIEGHRFADEKKKAAAMPPMPAPGNADASAPPAGGPKQLQGASPQA